MRRKLQVLWFAGGRIELDLPVVAAVVDGELRSRAKGARRAAPTDGSSASALARPWRRVSYAVLFKAFVRWSSLWSRVRRRRPAAAAGDGGGFFNLLSG